MQQAKRVFNTNTAVIRDICGGTRCLRIVYNSLIFIQITCLIITCITFPFSFYLISCAFGVETNTIKYLNLFLLDAVCFFLPWDVIYPVSPNVIIASFVKTENWNNDVDCPAYTFSRYVKTIIVANSREPHNKLSVVLCEKNHCKTVDFLKK